MAPADTIMNLAGEVAEEGSIIHERLNHNPVVREVRWGSLELPDEGGGNTASNLYIMAKDRNLVPVNGTYLCSPAPLVKEAQYLV